ADATMARLAWLIPSVCLASLVAMITAAILIGRSITRPLDRCVEAMARLADGDLTAQVGLRSADELGKLALAADTAIDRLHALVRGVNEMTREVASASTQIAASSEEVASGMNEQSTQIAQVTSA